MSFGFEHHNKAIDAAIDRAFKADRFMFTPASNEGATSDGLGPPEAHRSSARVRWQETQRGHEPQPGGQLGQFHHPRRCRPFEVEEQDSLQVWYIVCLARGGRDCRERSGIRKLQLQSCGG